MSKLCVKSLFKFSKDLAQDLFKEKGVLYKKKKIIYDSPYVP